MKRLNWFILFIISIFHVSCKKEFTTNTDEILSELYGWESFTITPESNDKMELFSEFEIRLSGQGYAVNYSESEKNIWGKETYSNSGTQIFHVEIDTIYMLYTDGIEIPIEVKDSAKLFYHIFPLEAFKVNSTFKIVVEYHYTNSDVKRVTEARETKYFLYSTVAADSLSQSIVYCEYPLYRQYNYLQDEYKYGFIKTKVKPDFLLEKQLLAVITDIKTGQSFTSVITYDLHLGILKYSMPELNNNTMYRIDYQMKKDGVTQSFYRSNFFKTSKYDNFSDKIGNILEGEHPTVGWEIYPYVKQLTVNNFFGCNELLEFYEQILPSDINHYKDFIRYDYPKLVKVSIDTNKVNLNFFGYDKAMSLGYVVNRPGEYIGYKPVNDFFYLINYNETENTGYSDILLTDKEIGEIKLIDYNISDYILKSYITATIFEDLFYFKNQASNDSRKNDSRVISILENEEYKTGKLSGKYYYKLKYEIPGINLTTFEADYEFGPMN